jgi:hypothetical protein
MSIIGEKLEPKEAAIAAASGDDLIRLEDADEDAMLSRRAVLHHIVLPSLLLLVALLGGVRFDGRDGSIVFLGPALICLFFGAALMVLFLRTGLIDLSGWVGERRTVLENLSNGLTLAAMFFASVQLFNSLLPEQGLPFWIVSFCVFWTLWNYLFTDLTGLKLLRGLTAMFVLAFAVKYLLLANLAKPGNEGWLSSMINNPGQAAATWLLDLPQFGAATGYVQFFTLAIFVVALYFVPRVIKG